MHNKLSISFLFGGAASFCHELGSTQNETPNINFAKPLAWGSQQPQPLLVVLRRGHYGQKPVKSAAPQQTESKLSFALTFVDLERDSAVFEQVHTALTAYSVRIARFFNPIPRPIPSPGRRLNRSHPLARSLRYPRPIRESRGDSLRNRVAIVCVRYAHLY